MKTFAKTFTIFALTLLSILSAPQLQAGGSEVHSLEIRMRSSENMIRRGNSLMMDVIVPQAGATLLSVTDVNGREVWTDKIDLESGQNRVRFCVGDLRAGTYFLEVTSGEDSRTQTFAVR